MRRHLQKWSLALSTLPVVVIVAGLKYVYHVYDFEVLPVSIFMSGLIAANVFLLGFLISGILMDYKGAERFPGELAADFAAIADEVSLLPLSETEQRVTALIHSLKDDGADHRRPAHAPAAEA